MKHIHQFLSLLLAVTLFACNSDDPGKLDANIISNLPADPPTGYGSMGQPLGTTGKYTLFSFESGGVIANTDSLTDKWDIGFRGTKIIINGGTDRIGNAGALIVVGKFNELKAAPDNGYATDDGSVLAIPSPPSTQAWYTYNETTKIVTPNAGKVIMIRTATGKYAKMEILSYYLDSPASPTMNDPARYYTFQYVYQPDGSKKF